MTDAPAPSVVLVNYAGYVVTANTFVADNSLATLAGSLEAENIPVQIVDLMTSTDVGSIGDRMPTGVAQRVLDQLRQQGSIEQDTYRPYRAARDAAQRAFEAEATARLLACIEDRRATVVGFKIWAGNGFSATIEMAEAVRSAFPSVRVIAGGPAATYCEEYLLKRTSVFDHVVSGDGERAIVAIARGRARNSPILRLDRRARPGGGIAFAGELDALPAPSYSSRVYGSLDAFFKLRVVDESRGCFNCCAFCAHPQLNGVTRKKHPERVVDELEAAFSTDGIQYFRLSGSNPPWKYLGKIGAEVSRRGLPIRYSAYASLNNVRADDMGRYAASGLTGLFFGVESGDPEILRRAHEKDNGSREHVVRTIDAAMQAGIYATVSVILPAPFETRESKERTFDLLCDIFAHSKHGSVMVLPAFLTPSSGWWNRRDHFGFELSRGVDEATYVGRLLDWDQDFLLPRNLVPDAGYRLHGKSALELFEESRDFIDRLAREGISTNVDDASFMVASMGGLSPERYKSEMLSRLVVGGTERLQGFVNTVNQHRAATAPVAWVADAG